MIGMSLLSISARASGVAAIVCVVAACGDGGATSGVDDTGPFVDGAFDQGAGDTQVADSASADTPSDASIDTLVGDTPSDGDGTLGDGSGKPCTATGGECAKTEYCDAPTCGSGRCASRPAGPSVDFQPVCGCDGVTYWNAQQAHANGASTNDGSTGSACSGPTTQTCGGLVGATCPKDDACVEDLSGFGSCLVSDASGQCWFVPPGASCGGVSFSQYRDCTSSTCESYCDAVKNGHAFRRDATCPT
jgi:hypothetical protein